MTRLIGLLATAAIAALTAIPAAAARQDVQTPTGVHAITWIENRAAIEQWLREAPIQKSESIPVGVTQPTRVYFAGDGPAASAAWKPLAPGRYKGFWESYKSEIAAYELDKLLELNMVPPTVERTVRGERGAMVMWVNGVTAWQPRMTVHAPDPVAWSRQLSRMRLFDWLVANIDRNAGNILLDGDYHLVLIDHSRAFTSTTDLTRMAPPTRIDVGVWERMLALTMPDLEARLGKWVGRGELRAMLRRRDRMQVAIDTMVRERGEASVLIR